MNNRTTSIMQRFRIILNHLEAEQPLSLGNNLELRYFQADGEIGGRFFWRVNTIPCQSDDKEQSYYYSDMTLNQLLSHVENMSEEEIVIIAASNALRKTKKKRNPWFDAMKDIYVSPEGYEDLKNWMENE